MGYEVYYRVVIEVVFDFLVVLYNVFGCTGTNLLFDMVDCLVDLFEVIVVKEVSGDFE